MKTFDFIKNKIKLNKSPKKRLLFKQISLLCITIFMFVCVVWAWFTSVSDAEATGLSVKLSTGDTMLISLDGGNSFVNGIDLLDKKAQQFIGESNKIIDSDGKFLLSMQDITSDGKTFFRPKFNEENGQRIPNTEENWDYATENRAYISQDIIFRTSEPCNIFMGSGTQIITSCEEQGKKLVSDTENEIGNKSSAGNFSKDCIVGALRISAIDTMIKEQNGTCRFVCIPRTDVELVRNGEEITMNTGNAVTDNAKIHIHYDSTYQTSGDTETIMDPILSFDEPPYITTTIKTTDKDGNTVYEATATINLWLEGCDSEVTRILSGGKYKIGFDFVAEKTN